MRDLATMRNTGRRQAGVGLVEVAVTVLIFLVMAAIAVPSFLQGYQNYKLNQSASQVEGVLKSARFQAIRQNLNLTCRTLAVATGTAVWGDTNGNGAADPGETQITLDGSLGLTTVASVPNAAGLAAAVGAAVLTPIPVSGGTLTFDVRGAPAPVAASVLYLNNTAAPRAGYRAVIVMPSGSMQLWTADTAGNWSQVN